MRLFSLVLATLCLCALATAQKKSDVEVLDTKVRRVDEGRLALDGRVKIGQKPLKGLILVFDFFSSENDPLTTEKIEVDNEGLEAGEETSFHGTTMNPPGAVRYRLRAFDIADRQLRIGNAGPFTIE